MKACIHDAYGSPDVIELRDLPMPEIADDGILVRVRASSVNAYDWHKLRGKPYMARIGEGLRKPKMNVLGVDAAGTVEVVGPAVTHVKPGDDVFGSRSGAFAEYLSGRNFVSMPAGLTFGEAAAVPTAGMTALQAVRDQARVQAGQRVLVNGAGGGVGTFAVQIAKSLGAEVTAVTNTANLDLVSSLGADHIVDHTRDDFTRAGPSYEVILDPGGTRSILDLRRTVTGDGTVVLIGPGNGQWIGPIARMAGAVVASRLGNRRVVFFLAKVNKDDLLVLKALIEEGKVRPVVDRTYSLADTADAVRYMEAGRVRGKVVITV